VPDADDGVERVHRALADESNLRQRIGASASSDKSQHIGSGITVVSQPTYEMGRTAAELLLQRMADKARPDRTVILKGDHNHSRFTCDHDTGHMSISLNESTDGFNRHYPDILLVSSPYTNAKLMD
jgi:hypothetical protein